LSDGHALSLRLCSINKSINTSPEKVRVQASG